MVLSAKAKRQAGVITLPVNKPIAKKKKRKLKFSGPGVVFLFLLAVALYSFGGQMVESYNVQKEVKKIQLEMEQLKEKNEQLQKEVKKLESQSWVERAAREKLGLVKPGEKVIMEVKAKEMEGVSEQERAGIEIH